MGPWVTFEWKEAKLRISCPRSDLVVEELKALRSLLDAYIARQPEFQSSLTPIELLPDAPEICRRMAAAALPCGVGPMAAVAGAVAQMCVEKALAAGAGEAIVENGGDIYIASARPVSVGLFAGDHPVSGRIALAFPAERLPVSVCSSSSRFGHSMSFGDCDLATIVSRDGALADAAATLAGNSVKSACDVEPALAKVLAIPGVEGVLIIRDGRVGVAGDLPPLVACADPRFAGKAFHDGDADGSVGPVVTR
jgi:uncharacterized protein